MKITISDDIYKEIIEFATARTAGSSGLYAYRGEKNSNKVVEDIIVGALGEYAIYLFLTSSKLKCTKPDYTIHEKGKKSFGADLICEHYNVHVKSQSVKSSKLYGNSWLFQRSDKLVSAPKDCDVLAFTCVDIDSKEVTVLGFTFATDIKNNNLWEECKVPSYRNTKVALYLKSFENHDIIKHNLEGKKMKKIKMVKHSGNPVETEELEKFREDFQTGYDAIIAEFSSDMKLVHEKVDKLADDLAKKYKTIIEVDFPKSIKATKQLVEKYGQYMVSTHVETGELIFVVLDMGIN